MSNVGKPSVSDIKIDNLPTMCDARGCLVVAEFSAYVPFQVVRVFYVHSVPINTIRGEHAHRHGRQYMICQTGRVLVDANDGALTRRIELSPGQAMLMECGIFFRETYVDRDTVLLVLCDSPFDSKDYIRTMEEFIRNYS